MAETELEIDFTTPWHLVRYFHFIGIVSITLNSFGIYLVLFKSSKFDNFRFFMLNFQTACTLTDFQLTYLMQPMPIFSIAGYSVGLWTTVFDIWTHHQMNLTFFLMFYQVESLVLCFYRKHQAIAEMLKLHVMSQFVTWLSVLLMVAVPVGMSVAWFFTATDRPGQLDYVRKVYPQYLAGFSTLPNFVVYEFTPFYTSLMVCWMVFGIVGACLFTVLITDIFRIMALLRLRISVATFRRHQAAVRSLMAQFGASSCCLVPPILYVVSVVTEMRRQQEFVIVLLYFFATHSSINVVVLIVTCPPYRHFVMDFFKKPKKSEATSFSFAKSQRSTVLF